MDNEQQNSERIEAYVMGRMTPEEEKGFLSEVEGDPELARQVELHEMMKDVLGNRDLMEFRQKVKKVVQSEAQAERAGSDPSAPRRLSRWIGVAVVLLLAGLLAWLLFLRTPPPEKLYARYFEAYPVYQVSRSEDNQPQLQKALEYYGAGRYEEARGLFLGILESGLPERELVQFYYGVSCMASGKTGEAEQIFRSLIGEGRGLFDQQSRWYLALALLKQKRIDEAVGILTVLSGEPGKYGTEAGNLLAELD